MNDDAASNTALDEVDDILGTEPDELSNLTEEEAKVAAKILPLIAAKANAKAELNKQQELAKEIAVIRDETKKILEEKIEEYRKMLTPPTPEELGALLNQEYAEFPVSLKNGSGKTRQFIIRELPLEAETKLMKAIQRTLGERLVEIGRIDWSAGMTTVERIEKVMTMVPGAVDTLADCCAVCLDPFGEQPDITGAWVLKNVGSQKLAAIIHAQIEASKYRDFLSLAGRFFPTMGKV